MDFTALLDTAIGLTIIYLGASLFVTIMNESIAAVLNSRGKMLFKNVEALLARSGMKGLLDNPMLKPTKWLKRGQAAENQLRSYIDPEVLAQGLVGNWLAPVSSAPKPDLFEAVKKLPDSELKNVLWTLAVSADNNLEKLTKGLGVWIDRSLTVLGEGYKRRVQIVSFVLGVAMAVGFNIDTIRVAERLYLDKELREAVAAGAEQFTQKTSSEVFEQCLKKPQAEREKAAECLPTLKLADALAKRSDTFGKLPIGWNSVEANSKEDAARGPYLMGALRLLGWLLTALAVSVGAPFWFDLLNRFVNIRSSIKKPEVAKEQK